ncbi:hypothetical protein AAAY24_06265 [Faecalibacillus faecis]|uniref:hypothetical protein n=1 Tax=Faecalibacillus faecis TaxID=1982628 RepID=UPI0032C0E0DA
MNEKRNILERINAYGVYSIIAFFTSNISVYYWLKKSYTKALGFNNIIINPQVSAVFLCILFYGEIILYYILMAKFKPKKEVENGGILCVIECTCFANFLFLMFILAVSEQASIQLTDNVLELFIFVIDIFLNIGTYSLFKIYELIKKKSIFEKHNILAFIIVEIINIGLLFFLCGSSGVIIYIITIVPFASLAIAICFFKEDFECYDNKKLFNKIKDKLREHRISISTVILVFVIFSEVFFVLLNEFNDNFLGKEIARVQCTFAKIETDAGKKSSNKSDGYLLFETNTGKYISIGYKVKENNHIKLNHNYKYIDVEGIEVSEEYFMIDID